MADCLIVLSPEGTIRSINPATTLLLGYRQDELVGRSFSDILEESPDRFLREGVRSIEGTYRTKIGTVVPVVLSASVVREMDGEIGGIVCVAHDISARKEAEREIRRLAYYDQLTSLPNRTLFLDRLRQAVAQAQREREKIALFFLDLDRFKEVNDTFGHSSGDLLLQQVARRLHSRVRKSDTLARLGGDEFVLLSLIHAEGDALEIAQGLLGMMAYPFDLDGRDVSISTSIGIVLFPEDGGSAEELLKHADMAMYAAKERGTNEFEFFSKGMNKRALERRNLESALRTALKEEDFVLHYQPQFDLHSCRLCGVEALVRWTDKENGAVPPGKFIPLAEETGLIRPLGEWVLRNACLQYQKWLQLGHPPIRLAVNISGSQFTQPDFVEIIDRVLDQTGIDPRLLELEITESTLMANDSATLATLLDLKVRGIQLAVDDFGTGYSSLNYLKHYPVNRLKIDQSFIRDIHLDKDDAAIVRAIVSMAHSLGLRVIAEGVESPEEFTFLCDGGSDEIQGHLFAPSMPADELSLFLKMNAHPFPACAPLLRSARRN